MAGLMTLASASNAAERNPVKDMADQLNQKVISGQISVEKSQELFNKFVDTQPREYFIEWGNGVFEHAKQLNAAHDALPKLPQGSN